MNQRAKEINQSITMESKLNEHFESVQKNRNAEREKLCDHIEIRA